MNKKYCNEHAKMKSLVMEQINGCLIERNNIKLYIFK